MGEPVLNAQRNKEQQDNDRAGYGPSSHGRRPDSGIDTNRVHWS